MKERANGEKRECRRETKEREEIKWRKTEGRGEIKWRRERIENVEDRLNGEES